MVMRVLIAEDDAGIRDLLHDLIERQGHAVTVARDGEEAWGLFEHFGARMVTAERVITLHRRREALLRLARLVATSTDPALLFATLLDEVLLLSGVEAGIVTRAGPADNSTVVA